MLATPVASALDNSLYIPDLRHRRKESVLDELVECAQRAGVVRHGDALRELLRRREALGSTSPGRGFAIPHARSLTVQETRVVVARSSRGLEWNAPDGEPVHLVALTLSPAECPPSAHLDLLVRVASVLRLQRTRQKMLDADCFDPIATLLREAFA